MGRSKQFDYIIIGAGTAGCCLANRLSSDSNRSVLLLEAGPSDKHPHIHDSRIPNIFSILQDRNLTASLPVEKEAQTANRWQTILRGTMLGGCSSNNAMIHVRGAARDFNNWHAQGNIGWDYESLLEYFTKSEHYEGDSNACRGREGPVSVRNLPSPSPVAGEFLKTAADLGFSSGEANDFNIPALGGKAGYYQFAINADNTRSSSATAYLAPVRSRKNLKVLTGHQVMRLKVEQTDAGGCRVSRIVCLDQKSGISIEFSAGSEVILCAGAIESPHLLLVSGIGPEKHLKDIGIDPAHPLPVGENLQDHTLLPLSFEAKRPCPEPMFASEAGLFVQVNGSAKKSGEYDVNTDGWPNIQYFAHPGIQALRPPQLPEDYLVLAPALVRPKSRGTITLNSPDPRIPPKINLKTFSEPEDLATLSAAVELTREFGALHRSVKPCGYTNLPKLTASETEKADFVGRNSRGLWHPVGTCKMGPSGDASAVVDSQLRVHGVDGLRVCDASIMPDIVCANTNPATYMIAEKAAALIRSSS